MSLALFMNRVILNTSFSFYPQFSTSWQFVSIPVLLSWQEVKLSFPGSRFPTFLSFLRLCPVTSQPAQNVNVNRRLHKHLKSFLNMSFTENWSVRRSLNKKLKLFVTKLKSWKQRNSKALHSTESKKDF